MASTARASGEPGGNGRPWLTRVAKALLSVAVLALLLWKVPIRSAWHGLAELSALGITSILILTFAFPAVAAVRWGRVLARLQVSQPWTSLMADTLVSSTYNMLLPTNIGGDVIRALRCARRVEPPHTAWSSVLYERLVGLVALALLAVPGLIMAPGPSRALSLVIASTVLVSVILVVLAHAPFRFAARLLASRAPVVAGVGDRIAKDLAGPLASASARAETVVWSALYQAVGLGLLVVVVLDWGQPTMLWAVLGAVPLALILTLLPVSIAGLGVRESLFVVLLGQFGVEAGRALSLAIVWLASAILLALAGGLIMLTEVGRPAPPRAPSAAESKEPSAYTSET